MRAKLSKLWEYLRTSYWFVPSVVIIFSAMLAIGLVVLDKKIEVEPVYFDILFFSGGPEIAGQLLSTIASMVITVTSIVFSITIVVLTLASNQFGSRLVRNFMADRLTQLTMGTFIGTFIFCLIVLSYVRQDGIQEVPRISVTFSIVLTIITAIMLSYYIHHIAKRIQADTVVNEISNLFERLIRQEFDSDEEYQENDQSRMTDFDEEKCKTIKAEKVGYIEAIDHSSLLSKASKHDLYIWLTYRAGQFVTIGTELMKIRPADKLDKETLKHIKNTVVLHYSRTPVQDVEYAMSQMVEVALRALSPAMNDSFIAISCVDRLGQGLADIAGRPAYKSFMKDSEGKIRVYKRPIEFDRLLDTAFSQIREMAKYNVAVGCRVLESLEVIAKNCRREECREAVLKHATLMHGQLLKRAERDYDKNSIQRRFDMILAALDKMNKASP